MRWRQADERKLLLQVVQPGLIGLIDGTISTLAPIFAAAYLAGSREALLHTWGPRVEALNLGESNPWDTLAELCWLAEAGARCGSVAEVGAYRGASARVLAMAGAQVTSVDDFRAGTRLDFLQNCAAHLDAGRIELIAAPSLEAAELCAWRGRVFDLVFIDGDHLRADVLEDLRAWEPLVRTGGIVAGHDAYPQDPENGVAQALRYHGRPWRVLVDSVWGYVRP